MATLEKKVIAALTCYRFDEAGSVNWDTAAIDIENQKRQLIQKFNKHPNYVSLQHH